MNLRDLVTPCFIYDIDRFELNINSLRDSFKRYYGNFRIGYSYKTNYFEPFRLSAKRLGVMAEVVSNKEYKLARSTGIDDSMIIYNGVIPDPACKAKVIKSGGFVHVDNMGEIKQLVEEYGISDIGIRVSFPIGDVFDSRFGFYFNGCYNPIFRIIKYSMIIIIISYSNFKVIKFLIISIFIFPCDSPI